MMHRPVRITSVNDMLCYVRRVCERLTEHAIAKKKKNREITYYVYKIKLIFNFGLKQEQREKVAEIRAQLTRKQGYLWRTDQLIFFSVSLSTGIKT